MVNIWNLRKDSLGQFPEILFHQRIGDLHARYSVHETTDAEEIISSKF